MAAVVILGTCDTKGAELAFVRERIREGGAGALLVDYGLRPPMLVEPDVPATQVAAAGGEAFEGLLERRGREGALAVMTRGLEALLGEHLRRGRLHGVIALGGSVGSAVAGEVMQHLPLGLPKLIVSTAPMAGMRALGTRDVGLMATTVDLLGLNRVTRAVLGNAAAAMAAMALGRERRGEVVAASGRPVVGVSCLGVVTPGALALTVELEARTFEVIAFHLPFLSGSILAEVAPPGQLAGEIRLAATELMIEVVSGNLATDEDLARAPERTEGPALVLVPGALDMLILPTGSAAQEAYRERRRIQHTPDVVLLRTTLAEMRELARVTARRANSHPGPARVVVPLGGFSAHDFPGGAFEDEEARRAYLKQVAEAVHPRVRVVPVPAHVNDARFARALAEAFVEIRASGGAAS